MSAAARCCSRSGHGTALPPTLWASFSEVSMVRLVTRMCSMPCALRCVAVSSLVSPAPTMSTVWSLKRAEHLQGQLDGRRAHAHRALADGRLGAHALADLERVPEQAVEDDTGAATLAGELIGSLHLRHDLRLADHHGVEARGDAEQVGDGAVARVAVEARLQLGVGDAGVARQGGDAGVARRQRVVRVGVQLGAVAGAERDGLAGHAALEQLLGHAQGALLVQRETLAQLERGGLVRDAGDDDEHAAQLP